MSCGAERRQLHGLVRRRNAHGHLSLTIDQAVEPARTFKPRVVVAPPELVSIPELICQNHLILREGGAHLQRVRWRRNALVPASQDGNTSDNLVLRIGLLRNPCDSDFVIHIVQVRDVFLPGNEKTRGPVPPKTESC